jgi:hypothetical protein
MSLTFIAILPAKLCVAWTPPLGGPRCLPLAILFVMDSMDHVNMPRGMISGTMSPVDILRILHGTNPRVKK